MGRSVASVGVWNRKGEMKVWGMAAVVVVVLCVVAGGGAKEEEAGDVVAELVQMEERSEGGVIHLDDAAVQRYAVGPNPRPYSLVIFFDALQMRDNADLRLADLRHEFQLMASAFIRSRNKNKRKHNLFFCDLEFKESQAAFALFGVNSLPHIRHVGPGSGHVKESDVMPYEGVARAAESMAAFVEAKTGVRAGAIERAPPVSTKQLLFIGVVVVASAPFLLKKLLLTRDTPLHDPKLWLAGAVFVYFFSVSGGMYNVIRRMPLFMPDRSDASKVVFFLQGSGMQLGAEGFAVGFLYTMVGLMLALVTHLLVYVRNQNVQRSVMLVGMALSFWAVKKVIFLDNWKTGYAVYGFWPSSWN